MGRTVDLSMLKLLILDVDGVLTDGTIIVGPGGEELKGFNSLDGHGIRLWLRSGLEVAFLSGRRSEPVEIRGRELGVRHILQDCFDKLPAVQQLLEKCKLSAEESAYIGDDVTDLPAMRYVGFAAAVANAVEEVKQCADYVTCLSGGKGAVREVIEYILKGSGRWQGVMRRYE